ncbi:hypothetical protein BHS09_12370 [Myxococcus xanthus]|uniref:B box-type domain-containing protein n=1 Tax=Myxococcus xanthus TaxID=34 RepID=A0AAE6FYT4_MYXXA|nr:tetratricopeptide repeat protein [Myxococcus xanthus]QDE67712.1 hypothetical protein BHS09_12370 [Myxococcus xanthus]QDE74990.1 hypothetical protein BHS08_12385 [Myxococcus xanthus]
MSPSSPNIIPPDAPLPRCQRHRTAVAGWRCERCNETLCPDCVVGRRAQTVELVACERCGDVAQTLLTSRSRVSVAQRLKGAWRYVFTPSGLQVMVAVSVFLAALRWLVELAISFSALIPLTIYGGVFWGTFFTLARDSARGEMALRSPDYRDYFHDAVLPGLRGVVTFAIVWMPAFLYVTVLRPLLQEGRSALGAWIRGLDTPGLLTVDPVLIGLLLLGVLWLPAALLITAARQPLLTLFDVPGTLRIVRRLGRDYTLVAGTLMGLGVLHLMTHGVALLLRVLNLFVISRVLAEAVTLIIPFTAAHVVGLLLYTRGDALGYGLEQDYLGPVLGDAQPSRMVPPLREAGPIPFTGAAATAAETGTSNDDPLEALAAAVNARDVPLAMSLYATVRQQSRLRVPPEHHLFVGQAAAVEGNFPLAVAALESAADTAPDEPTAPRALVLLARVLGERMHDAPRAEEVYRYVLHRYPDTAAARFASERVAPTSD